ncbi:hypothetical protein Pla52o_53270 [Novipirellula galeiformis]|uniref:Uncharacterized protein n=1 Tax=Novipirellula galeiformis TaxID=2528004 RepID=A0A5C6C110_9BACT|nr:hypothetical protein Pla52o_53270 [Novipirellula galeiformis]
MTDSRWWLEHSEYHRKASADVPTDAAGSAAYYGSDSGDVATLMGARNAVALTEAVG